MKNIFYGVLIGLISAALIGYMLFDNFKTKMAVAELRNVTQQIVNMINAGQKPPAINAEQKK